MFNAKAAVERLRLFLRLKSHLHRSTVVGVMHQQQIKRITNLASWSFFTNSTVVGVMHQQQIKEITNLTSWSFFTNWNIPSLLQPLGWKHLLQPDKYKEIIVSSLKFLSENNRIQINGFVIMINHLHLIWHINYPHKPADIQRDFLKYTAQQIKFDLQSNHPKVLNHFKVALKDRHFQFWQRNPLSVPLYSESILRQKLNYIHENPVRAKLVANASEYHYSSAHFYETGWDQFGFLQSIW